MSNPRIVPCIWMDNQAEQAAEFYTQLFRKGRITAVSHYPQSVENPGGKPRGSVLTVAFELSGHPFTALNGGPQFAPNPSISFFVHTDSAEETNRLASSLAEGGKVLMPLDSYPWSERYAWVEDRFGVSWQVMMGRHSSASATIVPCVMFANAQHGQAEAAMRMYTGAFPSGRIERIERYGADRGPEGKVVHGRFWLDGQLLTAMDSHSAGGATFNEGLSLQVMCHDQAEVDHYWSALAEGGKPGPCGWLKDRFGLSWQIVPSRIAAWMASDDVAASERTFSALMGMTKLDIAALDTAFKGG